MDESKWTQEDEQENELNSETTLESDVSADSEVHSETRELLDNERASSLETEQDLVSDSEVISETTSNTIRIEQIHSEAVVPVVVAVSHYAQASGNGPVHRGVHLIAPCHVRGLVGDRVPGF